MLVNTHQWPLAFCNFDIQLAANLSGISQGVGIVSKCLYTKQPELVVLIFLLICVAIVTGNKNSRYFPRALLLA
jgi:hypothetical protein